MSSLGVPDFHKPMRRERKGSEDWTFTRLLSADLDISEKIFGFLNLPEVKGNVSVVLSFLLSYFLSFFLLFLSLHLRDHEPFLGSLPPVEEE